ncbi:MAG TPA: L-seryl-tRNA(Sec) selenium transferase [Pyrinomonadaceae bacterium]|jgi:L-seryl-tRNA(Ser) seleniumtransferase|nr:L-seryl-tRNA(Sec) selenium transferase [Pyrinomonadaceae bacterium]
MPDPAPSKDSTLRAIPSVDQLLRTEAVAQFRNSIGMSRLTTIAREVTDEMRKRIQSEVFTEAETEHSRDELLDEAVQRIKSICERDSLSVLRRVINATGVILHTNLGRAPLSEAARNAVAHEAAGYCTLEYDPSVGSRGKRGGRVEELLTQLTGADAALVVNNCASAALLILTVLAGRGETIVSRGELVEIGGDFRVPDVMSNSGTLMVEVGSTNRTRLGDYKRALNENTRLIMRVHPSNYRIVGFTDAPQLSELASFAHQSGLPLYEDAGSGVLTDLSAYGLSDEPVISESIRSGADVVSFSGDKLLGAAQAGLIVGRRSIIDQFRKHSLYRALRADKLCLAALEATLDAHRRGAIEEIPTLRMLALSPSELEKRAQDFTAKLGTNSNAIATIIAGQSAVGGGSGPNVHPPTTLIALKHEQLTADQIEQRLRLSSPPVITRIADNLVLLDLRTVNPDEEAELLEAVIALDT